MIRTALIASLLMVLAFPLKAEEAEQEKEKAAVFAAEQWLNLIDEAKYEESWREASGYLRSAVKQEDFSQALKGARTPLGKVVWRKLKSARFSKELPGAPDGQYFVLQFDAEFENKKTAIETITPKLERAGEWRVSGYFIK